MAEPGTSDDGVAAALTAMGVGKQPTAEQLAAAKVKADADAKAAADAKLAADAKAASDAAKADPTKVAELAKASDDALDAATKATAAWTANKTPELKAAAQDALAAATAAKTAHEAALAPAAKTGTVDPAKLAELQQVALAAQRASITAPNDAVLLAASEAALKAVNDFVAQGNPAPAQTQQLPKPGEEVKLKAPDDKTISEAETQRLQAFAVKHGFSQQQADALLASARERELERRVKVSETPKLSAAAVLADSELGGSAERVNLTNSKAEIAAKHMYTAEELAELKASGVFDTPAFKRGTLRFYNSALASPALINGAPVKTEAQKLNARNPADLAIAFKEDREKATGVAR